MYFDTEPSHHSFSKFLNPFSKVEKNMWVRTLNFNSLSCHIRHQLLINSFYENNHIICILKKDLNYTFPFRRDMIKKMLFSRVSFKFNAEYCENLKRNYSPL